MVSIVYRKGKSLRWHLVMDGRMPFLFPSPERAIEVFYSWSWMDCLPIGHDFRLCLNGVVDSVPVEFYFVNQSQNPDCRSN